LKTLVAILVTLFLFSGCSTVSDEELRAAHLAHEKGALIIDVRTKEEFRVKHIENAINIPIEVFEKYYKKIPQNKELIVYCRSGSRSAMAAMLLKDKGRVVYDVATQGDWEREIPPVEK
jgi:phage shock protein E